ncbi:PEPxxWA-CTERM sorting domain-containing protein [Sphingomonas sp.]|jgi:hypothetical protein|uniref:PEPxxWA-CTERM sorting domain-containing protein n=1 Tax=Sphingomonas sp. TaxID=28214 RepID=UPI002DF158AE|nr:PEPxxWA-CTERM sorting domain-containing protein [Sphingomonas sp.]
MIVRSIASLAVVASVLAGTAALAQDTKSARLTARLPRAIVDPGAPGVDPAVVTQGQGFFAPSPTVFGNQPHSDKRVLKSFNALGDYDTRLLGRALVPPDTMGAVGTTQFVQLINGAFGVFDKNTGNLLGGTSDVGFWQQVGQAGTGGDPRILFNHQNQRWIAIGFGAQNKDINIAVSDTADALGNWKSTKFEGLAEFAPGFATIADYPTLAMDNNAIYIGTNNFRQEVAGGPTGYRGTSLFVLDKDNIFDAAGPSLTNMQVFNTPFVSGGVNDTTRGFAIQGVNSNEATDGKGHIVAASAFVNGVLAYDILNAGTGAATQSASQLIYTDYTGNAPARQPGRPGLTPLRNIDTLDDRIGSNAWEVNGKTYFTHTITIPGTDRTTVRVTVMDSNTKDVIQTLDLGEAGYDYYQAALAVTNGTAVVAYNRSGYDATDGKIRIYAQTLGMLSDGRLYLYGDAILAKESHTAGYLNGNPEATGVPNGRQRWGDYAAVTLDPTDDHTFWVIGEYAADPYEVTRPGYPAASGFSRWGQYVVAVDASVPEPATWAMMIAGFGMVGFAARRSQRVTVRVTMA